jgi:hypothetical protein
MSERTKQRWLRSYSQGLRRNCSKSSHVFMNSTSRKPSVQMHDHITARQADVNSQQRLTCSVCKLGRSGFWPANSCLQCMCHARRRSEATTDDRHERKRRCESAEYEGMDDEIEHLKCTLGKTKARASCRSRWHHLQRVGRVKARKSSSAELAHDGAFDNAPDAQVSEERVARRETLACKQLARCQNASLGGSSRLKTQEIQAHGSSLRLLEQHRATAPQCCLAYHLLASRSQQTSQLGVQSVPLLQAAAAAAAAAARSVRSACEAGMSWERIREEGERTRRPD